MSTPKRFVNSKQNSQIVLWGTGECYKRNIKEILKKVKPAFVCDNDKQKWGSMIGGLKCVQPQKIKEIKTPFIVIMIDNPAIALEVAGQIMDMEIYTFDIFSNWKKYANDFIRVVKKG